MFNVNSLLRFTPGWCILKKSQDDICWEMVSFRKGQKLYLLLFIELKLNANEILK